MAPSKPAQLPLFGDGLMCAFGEPWLGARPVGGYHCRKCAAEGRRLGRSFAAAVKAGRYDAQGFTPSERAAQRRTHARASSGRRA